MVDYSEDFANVEQDFSFILNDLKFFTAFRATGVTDGSAFSDVVVQNPSGSGVFMYVETAHAPNGLADLDIAQDITIDTAGTAATVIGALQNGTAPSVEATIEEGGTYTTDGDTISTVVPGSEGSGVGVARTGGALPAGSRYIIHPGESVRETLTNRSGGSTRSGHFVSWFEIEK